MTRTTTRTATKIVVVSGYPKSGTTWCSRLVAEAIGCPSGGYLSMSPRNSKDPAIEGLERISDFALCKSHHKLAYIRRTYPGASVIHMVRDPRDVAVSGAFFFNSERYNKIKGTEVDRFEVMVRTLCDGGPYPGCQIPWAQRARAYMEAKTFLLRYEDLLDDPLRELWCIVTFLGLARSEAHLRTAIENQSFAAARKRAEESNKQRKIRLVRKGQKGGFREYLTGGQIARIEASCKAEMAALGYEV